MPIENFFDPRGFTDTGRWDYGAFMIPPVIPKNLTLPSPSITPEAFNDTAVVNGTAFPYLSLPPDAIRFRILNAANDRSLNLQWYSAAVGPAFVTSTGDGLAQSAQPIASTSGTQRRRHRGLGLEPGRRLSPWSDRDHHGRCRPRSDCGCYCDADRFRRIGHRFHEYLLADPDISPARFAKE